MRCILTAPVIMTGQVLASIKANGATAAEARDEALSISSRLFSVLLSVGFFALPPSSASAACHQDACGPVEVMESSLQSTAPALCWGCTQADGTGLSPGNLSIASVSVQPSTQYNETSGTEAITGFSSTVSVAVSITNVTG